MIRFLLIAAALSLGATAAGAQGNLSAQGFGYPPGQLSTRALAMGGGFAEFDPQSAINPQAVGSWGPAGLYFQYDPEFRRVSVGPQSARTTTARFPVLAAAVPLGTRFAIGVAASTFLDRSWATQSTGSDTVFGTPVDVTERVRSVGAINDVRLAGSFAVAPSLRLGVAVHALTGENRLQLRNDFTPVPGADTTTVFQAATESRTVGYSGAALSAGAEWRPSRAIAVAASARRGGDLRADAGDTLIATARVPNRYGVGVRYEGLRGATLAARVNWEGWSSLADLTPRDGLPVSDTFEYGVGADVAGPRIGASTVSVRLGVRLRDLPFGLRAEPTRSLPEARDVRELAFSGGLGIPLASNRAMVDLALQHASRSASSRSDVDERAWTLSLGLRVRP